MLVSMRSHEIRAVARLFAMGRGGGALSRTSLVVGFWGYPPPANFQIWRLRNAIFSTCHEICLRKIDLEYENGKQLQVTIIKITESKETKSIQRLDVSGSTGPGGQLPPCPPASYGSGDRSLISYPYLTEVYQ